MKIQDLMEKLSKMDKNQELIVEGLEDEVETTEEETVDTPEETNAAKKTIDFMAQNKIGHGGKMYGSGAEKDLNNAEPIGEYRSNESATNDKKCKVIAKVMFFRDNMNGVDANGQPIDVAQYLDQFPSYYAWWKEHKDEYANSLINKAIDKMYTGIEDYDEEDEELDECGSACGKVNECGSACSKPVTEEAEEPIVEEEEPVEESAEVIEERLNEQMKSDYQKELESISDFLF